MQKSKSNVSTNLKSKRGKSKREQHFICSTNLLQVVIWNAICPCSSHPTAKGVIGLEVIQRKVTMMTNIKGNLQCRNSLKVRGDTSEGMKQSVVS